MLSVRKLGGSLGFLHETGNRFGELGALALPVGQTFLVDVETDGRFIERIGYYNPMEEPSVVKVDPEKAKAWMEKGAQPTDTVKALFKKHGVI